MKLGCHCVLFQGRIATEPQYILNNLGKTGFSGVEMGARFIGTDKREFFTAALQEAGLELAALHVGVPMELWQESPQKAIAAVLEAADFVKDNPNKNLTMSGHACEKSIEAAKAMNEAARQCRSIGVTLNYHNHASEFLVRDAITYRALREYAPDLSFGFDLGWVQKGGFDPYDVLNDNKGRVKYVHIRDFDRQEMTGKEREEFDALPAAQREAMLANLGGYISPIFPDIGDGKTDFAKLLAFLEDYLPADGWGVVEYETGPQDFERYRKAYLTLSQYRKG